VVVFTGREDWCDILLNKFKWGHSFKDLNLDLLKKYQACSTSAEVIQVQNEHMRKLDEEVENETRGRWNLLISLLMISKMRQNSFLPEFDEVNDDLEFYNPNRASRNLPPNEDSTSSDSS
jgi:Ribosome biogenesis protein, C-terminal